MGEIDEALISAILKHRDENRPDMRLVVETIDRIFENMPELGIEKLIRGPDHWTWRDPGMVKGLEKIYSVTGSALAGAEGHPVLTIRQSLSARLDSYVTFSILVCGPGPEEIERCLTSAVVHHTGAYAGLRSTIAKTHAGGLAAGLAHAMEIGGAGPITADDVTSGRLLDEMRRFIVDDQGSGDVN